MSDNQRTACERDTQLENFAAELTNAVYPRALRRGLKDSWIEMELGLWRALAETLKKWEAQRPPAASAANLEAWREGLLVDLTESALYIAVRNGIKGVASRVGVGLLPGFPSGAQAGQPCRRISVRYS